MNKSVKTEELAAVANAFDLNVGDLLVRTRNVVIVEARQAAMYILWNLEEPYSLTEIGDALGGRTAATVSHGYRQTAERLRTDGKLRDRIAMANAEIRRG